MALEKEVNKESRSEASYDLSIAVKLAKTLIAEGGYKVIETAMSSSKDPSQVIGQFLLQLGSEVKNVIETKTGSKFNSAVLLMENGWLEQVSDYLQDVYNIPNDVMVKAEQFVGTAALQMNQSAASAAQTQGQPEQAPALPVQQGVENGSI